MSAGQVGYPAKGLKWYNIGMIKLDDNLLIELGLGALPKDEKTSFLKHMYETLEMRVGTRLAEKMSDAQMAEFEQFINSNDEQGAFRWLEANFPNYKDVVAEEFEKLKGEIKPVAPQILATSMAHTQATTADPPLATGQFADVPSQPAQLAGSPLPPMSQPQQPAPASELQSQSQPETFDRPPLSQQPHGVPGAAAHHPQQPNHPHNPPQPAAGHQQPFPSAPPQFPQQPGHPTQPQ